MPSRRLALLALVALTCSCERNVGRISVKLLPSAVTADDPLNKSLVASLRFRVDGPSGLTGPVLIPLDGNGELPGIPTGDNQIVTVEGVLAGVPKSRARSAPLTIDEGENTLELYMGIIGQFSRAPARAVDGSGAGGLVTPRAFHTTTLLRDGRLLVFGGADPTDNGSGVWRPETGKDLPAIGSAEAAHQDSLRFSALSCPAGTCSPRALHTATRLADGTVLIAGGQQQGATVAQLQTFIPGRGFFLPGDLKTAPAEHAAALMDDSVVLVGGQGGTGGSAALRAVIRVNSGGEVSSLPGLKQQRRAHALVQLDDGRLVAIGGFDAAGKALASTEVYRPGSPVWVDGPTLQRARGHLRVARLGDGYVISGGLGDGGNAVETLERLRVEGDQLIVEQIGELRMPIGPAVWMHTATTLDDSNVLLVGGFSQNKNGAPTNSVVQLTLQDSGAVQLSPQRPLNQRRAGHTATLVGSGNVVVVGGVGPTPTETVEIFVP